MFVSFDTSKKHAPNSLGAVLVLGLGKSGAATAQYCAALLGSRVSKLVIAAGEATEKSRAAAAEFETKGATVLFDTYSFEDSFDICIASPGISENSDFYHAAREVSASRYLRVDFLPPSGDVFRLALARSSPGIPCRRSFGSQGSMIDLKLG